MVNNIYIFLCSTQLSLPIKGGCVVTCIVDVDVTTTPDERGVGGMVDATEAKGREIWPYLYFNMSGKENFTTPKLQLIV